MKRRIMSRANIARIMIKDAEGNEPVSYDQRRAAQLDMMLHLMADGKSLKVYDDPEMGGPVVEIEDE